MQENGTSENQELGSTRFHLFHMSFCIHKHVSSMCPNRSSTAPRRSACNTSSRFSHVRKGHVFTAWIIVDLDVLIHVLDHLRQLTCLDSTNEDPHVETVGNSLLDAEEKAIHGRCIYRSYSCSLKRPIARDLFIRQSLSRRQLSRNEK